MRAVSFLRFCLVIVAVATVACSSTPDEPAALAADELSYELFPTTSLLDADDLGALVAGADGTLTFPASPSKLANVKVGHVLLAGVSTATPQGLMRVVTSVKREGAGLTLRTMQAPIQLAFRKLHVKIQRDGANIGAKPLDKKDLSTKDVRPQDVGVGFDADAEQPLDFLLFDADSDPSTTNDQIGIRGSIGGGFHFGISVDVDWGAITDLPDALNTCLASLADPLTLKLPDCSLGALVPEAKVSFEANPHMRAHASLYGAASLSYEKDFDVASIPLSPIPIGPLVFIPTVDITAKVEGEASAGFTVGAHGAIELTSSVTLSSKHIESPDIVPISVKKAEFVADDTKVVLQASAKVGLGARLNVELYGVVGPYAEAIAFAQVKADALANPCWSLHIGVDTVLGVKVTTPTIPFIGSLTLLDWKGLELTPVDEVISTGSCLPVEKGPPRPPGTGPDAITYATPTFTPWAHVSGPVGDDGAIHSFLEDGREWTDAPLAIDGRYVAVGSRNEVIVKFDDTGKTIWSRRFRREPNTLPFSLIRVVPTHDAAMMVLTQSHDGERASLLKLGQGGGVYFRKTIELAADAACDFEPFGLVRDTQNGFYVLAKCLGDERAAIAHLDENANVLGVRVFADPNPRGSTGRSITPTVLTTMGSDVVVLGTSATTAEGQRMFAIRLGDAGGPVWANRVLGCSDAPDFNPSQARIDENQKLTVVGTAADHRMGLVMRLNDDGNVAFANFSRFDLGGDKPFGIQAFAELPTTGILVAGSTMNTGLPSGSPGTETSLTLASLDSIGRTLWARSYTLPNLRSLNHASLHVTDDGGALVTGMAQHTGQPGGSLYAMKAFAKDGDLAGAPGVAVTQLSVVEPLAACSANAVAWPAVVTNTTGASVSAVTIAEDAAIRTE